MRGSLAIVVTLCALACVFPIFVAAADGSADVPARALLHQTFTLTVLSAGGTINTSYTVALAPTVQYENIITGDVPGIGTLRVDCVADSPSGRVEVLSTSSSAAADGVEPEAGGSDAETSLLSFDFALQYSGSGGESRAAAAVGAFDGPGLSSASLRAGGSYHLLFTDRTHFVLQLYSADATEVVTIVGTGDWVAAGGGSFWTRYGVSIGVAALFFVLKIAQTVLDNKYSEKARLRQRVVAAAQGKEKKQQ